MVSFTIPGELPDLNQIIEAAKSHYGAYAKLKRTNTELVAWQAKQLPKMERVNVTCRWICKDKRKDKDNIMAGTKFILDGLVMAGKLENDGWKQIGDINHEFDVDKDNPRVEVELEVV